MTYEIAIFLYYNGRKKKVAKTRRFTAVKNVKNVKITSKLFSRI